MSKLTTRKRKVKIKTSKIKNQPSKVSKFNVDSINFKNFYLNLGHVSYILRDWIKNKSQLLIPSELIDCVFTINYNGDLNSFKTQMKLDEHLQRKFLDHILDSLLNESRYNFVSERLNHLYIRDRCFRELASIFNSKNSDINTKVTSENVPSVTSIMKLFRCSRQIAECITPEEMDAARQFILHQHEIRCKSMCDCCIQTYISKDIDLNTKNKFSSSKKFVKRYNLSNSLVKNPLHVANFEFFQHLI